MTLLDLIADYLLDHGYKGRWDSREEAIAHLRSLGTEQLLQLLGSLGYSVPVYSGVVQLHEVE